MKIETLDFRKWTTADVETKLGLRFMLQDPELDDWLTVSGDFPSEYRAMLETLRLKITRLEAGWNEFDLMCYFIGPLLTLVDFQGEKYDGFFHRKLEARLEAGETLYEVSGFADWLVAAGRGEPQRPYFFLSEYKRQSYSKSDPLGQLLIAMLTAQKKNEDFRPLYGCYVIGSSWRFVRLSQKTYARSETFDASASGDFKNIWLILQKTKMMIESLVGQS